MCVRLQPLVDALQEDIPQHRVLHADETPVAILKPVRSRRTAPTPGPMCLEPSRTRRRWSTTSANRAWANTPGGSWVTGGAASSVTTTWGYKQGLAQGLTEVGCLAHARRKFFDLHAANKSQIAEFVQQQFTRVYDIERERAKLGAEQRQASRQRQTQPVLGVLYRWDAAAKPEGAKGLSDGQGAGLQPAALGGDDPIRRRRTTARGQQLDRELNQAHCPWVLELVVCR